MTEDTQSPAGEADAFPDAGRIVDAFGGVRPMASRLGVAATTIQGWKSRGNIPEGRRQEVRDAAQAAGIDLSQDALPNAAAPAESAGEARARDDAAAVVAMAAASSGARPARGVAWLALTLAVVAVAGLATQSLWRSGPSGGPAVADLADRVAALETAPAAPVAPAANLTPLVARIDALEAAARTLGETAARRASATLDLTPRLDALDARRVQDRGRLDALDAQRVQDRGRLDAAMERLEALSAARQKAGQSETARRAAELESVHAELAALRTRLDAAGGRDGSVKASAASLVLAVAALEDALLSGAPFKAPLSVIERFAGNDSALAELIAVLAPHAGDGIATRARLTRDFDAIAAQLSAPLWPETGVAWIDGVLKEVDSLVTIRRLEDAEGRGVPAIRAERALADNDLPGAIAALKGIRGPGAAWAARATLRVAADRAIAGLRLRAIDALAQPAGRAQ